YLDYELVHQQVLRPSVFHPLAAVGAHEPGRIRQKSAEIRPQKKAHRFCGALHARGEETSALLPTARQPHAQVRPNSMTSLPLVTAVLLSPLAVLRPASSTSAGWAASVPYTFTLATPARPYMLATFSICTVPTPVSAKAPAVATASPAAMISLVTFMVLLLLVMESIKALCACTWIFSGGDENPSVPRMDSIRPH